MAFKLRFTWLVLLAALWMAAPSLAEEEGTEPVAADPKAAPEAESKEQIEARSAFTWLKAAEEFRTKIAQSGRVLMEAAREGKGFDPQKRQDWIDASSKLRQVTGPVVKKAQEAFRAAFAKTAWDAWDAEKDAEILERGLDATARHELEHDPAKAVAALEHLLEHCPDARAASYAKSTWLPIALSSTGDFEHARKRMQELHDEADEKDQPGMLMNIGDAYAMEGKYQEALDTYAKAKAAIPAEITDRRDPRGRVARYLDLRTGLLGKPAPALGDGTWLGAERKTLASLKGQVVLLDFWATWCGPCLRGMPGLQKMHEHLGATGLNVIGVTREYKKRGVLPEVEAKDGKPALPRELYKGETMEAYIEHLSAFRTRQEITYPFAVVAGDVISKQYLVTGIPTMVVIDPDGTVGFIAVGGAREKMLEVAIARRLNTLKSAGSD